MPDLGPDRQRSLVSQHSLAAQRILVAEPLGKEGLEILEQRAQVDVHLTKSPEDLRRLIPDYHALIVRSGVQVDEALFAAGTNLVVVGRAGVGVDNIDVDAATRHGITVVNAPTTNIVAAAEHTIALLFALARKIPQADCSLRAHEWERSRFVGVELVGKQLGLVGLGRVGSQVASRAIGLGMQVVAYDPYISDERAQQLQVKRISLPELLSTSDFISLHLPATRETNKLIGAREFEMVKPGARLVNAARGALLDEDALLDALDANKLSGAALDVFEGEPPANPRLLRNDRVVLTPHIGGSTLESQTRVSLEIADQVLAVLENRPAAFAVNVPFVSPSLAPQLPPFIRLAECLGRFYTQWVGGPLDTLEVEFAGALAEQETGVLTAAVIKGLFESISEDRVNLVNARLVAQSHGLRVSERKSSERMRYDSSIGIKGARRVVGTVLQGRPHIVQLDGYAVEFAAEGNLLLTRHRDRPGMIGKVGTLLGNADVNIAAMQVARDTPRGESIMVLLLDDAVPPNVLDQLYTEPDIQWVKGFKL